MFPTSFQAVYNYTTSSLLCRLRPKCIHTFSLSAFLSVDSCLTVNMNSHGKASVLASGCDLSSLPAQSPGFATAVTKCKYTCKCHSFTVRLLLLCSLTSPVKWPPMWSPVAGSLQINVSLNTFLQPEDQTFKKGGIGKCAAQNNQKGR